MTHIEKMKQWLEVLEEAVHYTSAPVWSPSMTKECNEAITSLRQAIAEAEKQEPVAWKETHGKVIKALAGIVNVHTPDNLFDLDAIPREPVMGLVQQIKVAIDAYQPQRTKQEPVIDKSAAIRIATALGWGPKREWVGLTDEEIRLIDPDGYAEGFPQQIQQALKQKNGYTKENT